MKQDFYAASAAGVACVNAYTTHLTLKINCSLKTAILVLFISLPLIGNSQTAYTFSHQKGHSGRELVNVNGKLMQGVHEEHITVYVLRNTAKSLIVPENSFGYTRWFNYQTDSAIVTGTLGNLSGYSQVPGNKGYYNASNYAGDPTFSHNSNISSGVIANIACDLSYYKDYTVSYYPVYLIEPTLSQRVIFEVRPAQEIANALDLYGNTNGDSNGSYLEHYTITAPTGTVLRFGPEYSYLGSNSNYYYYYPNKNRIVQVSAGTWYKTTQNGTKTTISSPTIKNNRVIEIDAVNSPQTITYTLIVHGKGLAKFTVNYQDIKQVGPITSPIIDDATLSSDYQYIAGMNFDTNSNIPLDWSESGYGFYYPDLNSNTYRTKMNVYWGEYAIMNQTPAWSWLKAGVRDMKYQKTGSTDGNFFYVDASKTPGVIANLAFKDGNLCANSKLFISAWVNNLGQGTKPNLNFSLLGYHADGSFDNITTYTTGDIDAWNSSTPSPWKHIFFEVEMPNIEYNNYRLRIVNNAQDASGNDFAIDDIAVYMHKPGLMSYQTNITCSERNQENAGETVMLRLDPSKLASIPEVNGVKTIYYQFQKMDGTPIVMPDYWQATADYGVIKIGNKITYDAYSPDANRGMTALEVFMEKLEANPAINKAILCSEPDPSTPGTYSQILYVYHKNPIFTINNKYKSVIAATPTELNEQSSCGLVYDFQLDPKARLLVNGVSMSSLESDDICADQYNRIGIELYGTQNGLTQVVPGSCAADWLEGHEEDYTGEGCYATYNYQNIINAISTFRTYYPSNRNLDNCTAIDGFTNQQLELLNELVTRRMLELYKYEIERRVAVGTIYFTALPISNSAVAPDGTTKLSVCEMPIVVKLSAKQNDMNFNFGYDAEITSTQSTLTQNKIIRISANQANSSSLQIPILKNASISNSQLNNAKIYLLSTTTDKSEQLPIDKGNASVSVFQKISVADQISDNQKIMTLSDRDSKLNFLQGHRYDFLVIIPASDQSCSSTGLFSLIVVPDYVVWNPKENSNSWNVDRNWDMIDAQGNVKNTANGYVPASHTNVVISHNTSIPVLQYTSINYSDKTIDPTAQPNIEWEYNYNNNKCEPFAANTCQHIHFNAHAQLAGQQHLVYNKAWVDLPLATDGWNLIAPPFEDMVVGDMYIPIDGNTNDLFTQAPSPNSRRHYEFWTSLFNSTGYQIDINANNAEVAASGWTNPFNSLKAPIVPAHGYSVKVKDHHNNQDTVIVRLPKRDNIYYYFGSYGEQTSLHETIERTENGHRLAGTNGQKTNAAIFDVYDNSVLAHLMANPYMAELDMVKFFEHPENQRTIGWQYSYFSGTDRTPVQVDLRNNINTKGEFVSKPYIPSNTSFLVHLEQSALSNPYLEVTPEMIRDYDNSPSQQIRYAPEQNRKVLIVEGNRNGVISSCVLFEKHDANNNFDTKEDTRLIMMKKDMNPSAIYTNTDNVALSINIMNNIDMTPLGYSVIDNSEQESLTITFKGVENFSKQLQLFDAQTQISIDIEEDLTLTLPELENNAARYFIKYAPEQTSGFDNIFEETDIKIFQPAQGEVVVTASNTINQIDVFAINGSLIQQRNDINNAWQSFNLPMGAYLFVVKTETGLHRQKVLVK